jgi:tetratricopeptide (TPR) repeat protein
VATTITELALTASDRGEIGRANDLARSAMEIDRVAFGPRDLRVARDLELLARLHAEIEGEHGMADSAYRAALVIFASHHDAGHPDVIRVQNGMAANLRNMRKYAEAESLHRDVLAKYRRLHPEGHPDIATALHDLGVVLGRQQKFGEAETAYVDAIAMRRRLVGDDLGTVQFLNDLGVLRAERGDLAGAESALRESVERGRVALGPTHPSTVSSLGNLAVVLTREKKLADAELVLRDVVAARRASRTERPGLARALTSLGVVLRDAGRYRDAEQPLREAERIARENPKVRTNLLAGALAAKGVLFVRQGRLPDGEAALREAVTLRRSYLDSVSTVRLSDEWHWGNALMSLGRYAAAESVLVPAFTASAHGQGNRRVHADLARVLVRLYTRSGRAGEAKKYVADTVATPR